MTHPSNRLRGRTPDKLLNLCGLTCDLKKKADKQQVMGECPLDTFPLTSVLNKFSSCLIAAKASLSLSFFCRL